MQHIVNYLGISAGVSAVYLIWAGSKSKKQIPTPAKVGLYAILFMFWPFFTWDLLTKDTVTITYTYNGDSNEIKM